MAASAETVTANAPPHPLVEFWNYFSENKGALAGLAVFVLVCFVALTADFLAPHAPNEQFRQHFLQPPFWQEGGSLEFPLGTDAVGRDILSRLMHGARYSLTVGLVVVAPNVSSSSTTGAGHPRGTATRATQE